MLNKNNILAAKVMIKGFRPVLFHHFGPDSLPTEKKEKTGVAGNDPEEWKKSVLITENHQLYIEPNYIFACFREGAKYTKKGRRTLQGFISATLQVADEKILINRFLPEKLSTNTQEKVYLDIRSVKNPVTKGRNIRYRVACSPGWDISFMISWDKTIISRAEMEAIIRDSGMYSGLGDARNIGFGRFELVSFEVIESAQDKAAERDMAEDQKNRMGA